MTIVNIAINSKLFVVWNFELERYSTCIPLSGVAMRLVSVVYVLNANKLID